MKIFISIGSGPGIGFATAERFAREGFRVILASRNETRARQLVSRLVKAGTEAELRVVNAADPDSVRTLIAEVQTQFGRIDVLHYNAASLRKETLSEQPCYTFNSDLAVNVGGALAAAQAVMPGMAERQCGSILLTGGHFAITPNPDFLSLSLGKAAIRALAIGLFEPAKQMGIHVATVTVAAYVKPDSEESAGVAEAFWALHSQAQDRWVAEAPYSN